MSLLELQRDFRRHLTDTPVAMNAWFDTPTAPGLAIYHNAYRVQLTDCLAETFAQVHAWLGGDAFVAAARAYIEASPPNGWTLGDYGEKFDRTLASLYPDDPEVAELAQLEWLLSRAFESVDADPLPASAIAGIDWDRAGVAFVPSLRAVPAHTNAGAIWSALAGGTAPPVAAMLPEPGSLLIWRQAFAPCFRTIEAIEELAIAQLSAGASFAGVCAMLVGARGEADGIALAGTLLGQWFRDGLILHAMVHA